MDVLVTADRDCSYASALNVLLRGRHSPQRYSNTYILNLSSNTTISAPVRYYFLPRNFRITIEERVLVIFHEIEVNMADYCDVLVIVYFWALYLLLCLCRDVFCALSRLPQKCINSSIGARYMLSCYVVEHDTECLVT